MSSSPSPAGGKQIQLTLILRPPEAVQAISQNLLAGTYDPSETLPEDLAANPADIQAVTDFAAKSNLHIVKIDPAARSVRVAGSMNDVEKAFGAVPSPEHGSVESLNYKGPINLPPALQGAVIAVLGLDQTPIARPHSPQ